MPDFLLEIGCEEIPARMIEQGAAALWGGVRTLLNQLRVAPRIVDPSDYGRMFSTPRRLAVFFPDLLPRQPDATETVTGPALNVAFKDGVPTPAGHAFAKKVGQDISQLKTVSTPKGDYLAADVVRAGRPTYDLLAEMLPSEIFGIPWAKTMYWKAKNDRFVRPIRWIVALLDDKVVPVEAFGVRAQNVTCGHRVLGSSIVLDRSDRYTDALSRGMVVAQWKDREDIIRKALDAATRALPGARWREDKALLDTVVNLTEFPSVILGGFDPQFLILPEEVLVTVMRDHQKYFAVEDAAGKLLPHFLAVLNTESDPKGLIRHGNERVLRARFNDARFFWQTDQKKSLLERLDLLKHLTFQKDLGSYYDKTQRVQRLCSWLSELLKQRGTTVRPGVIHKAVCLAKADLTTELVKEFTELQGIVGGLYARAQELDASLPEATRFAIADAIYDHYKPESTDDAVPRSMEGAVLSIGDKADTIAGMFALGLVPSGSKDPFALRRQANGIVKVIAEKKLPLKILELMKDARAGYQKSEAEKKFVDDEKYVEAVKVFFRERLEFYLRDVCGYSYDVVKAVLGADADDVVDAEKRAAALTSVRRETKSDFESVCVSFKRIKNILDQAREKGLSIPNFVDESLNGNAGSPEDDLWRQGAVNVWAEYEVSRTRQFYVPALMGIASLRPKLDRFFEEVMVMVPDAAIRGNRLAILNKLFTRFSTIADFSEIATEVK
ncbi:MAG: glycine--tRNA ligase subunit beta [Candidatus Sulfotelmatobacter sp.]